MIIRRMRIPILRMLHQPRHSASHLRPARTLHHNILNSLTELQRPVLRRRLHGKVIAEPQHRRPPIAVEVVHGATGADDQVVLATELAERGADFHVVVGVVAGVGGDDGGGWAGVREHANENEVDVVDPLEGVVAGGFETGLREEGDAPVGGGQVGVELVVDVFGGVDVGNGAFAWVRVRRDFNAVAVAGPVGALGGVVSVVGDGEGVWSG